MRTLTLTPLRVRVPHPLRTLLSRRGVLGAAALSYVKLLMGMDLTKHFYFSYTYNLAHTVQRNCQIAQQRGAQQAAAQLQQLLPMQVWIEPSTTTCAFA